MIDESRDPMVVVNSTQLKTHLAKIGGYGPSKGGDKVLFAYHVIT